jgi:hypothetical protein
MGRRPPTTLIVLLGSCALAACAGAGAAPSSEAIIAGAWGAERIQPIAEQTRELLLPLERGVLTAGEQAAAAELLAAGERLHDLYLLQLHRQALDARDALAAHPERTDLADLFRVMKGPIATTLENAREPFLAVEPEAPGRNVYPPGVTREGFDGFLAAHPGRRDELLALRSVVQEATPANLARALATLEAYPALDTLHPRLRERLAASEGYIAVPYSVVYAEDLMFVYDRLNVAADLVEAGDRAFARYLRLKARDLLADDYDGGDAAWVSSRFEGALNAQIGSYETYDDPLYGAKSFFSLSLLQRDRGRSEQLAAALGDIQAIEDALPYEAHKRVRADIPVGVYNVIADFGQARGVNTATILPNESHLARQYGRTILLRANIMTSPELFAISDTAFNAATVEAHHGDLTPEGGFQRTLWHEVGHYLGVDRTADGRELGDALEDTADLFEEMKADLVSLFAARRLHERGVLDDAQLRGIYASGIRRVLQNNQPRRDQPYQTMQLMQWNWFLDRGLLGFEDGRLAIRYERYPEAVESLLTAVLDLQRQGDRAAAEAFVVRWIEWDEARHGAVARRMREAASVRYTLVRYEALGETAGEP